MYRIYFWGGPLNDHIGEYDNLPPVIYHEIPEALGNAFFDPEPEPVFRIKRAEYQKTNERYPDGTVIYLFVREY